MPERQAISQGVQIGVEGTAGTAVAANKKLQALGISPSINADFNQFRPIGQKYLALSTLGKEWIEADLSGAVTYSEIIYPLASVLSTPTSTQYMDTATATGAYRWQFDSSSSNIDSPKTFTVEQGDSVRAHRFAYGIVSELGVEFSRESVELSGTMLGRALEDGVTLTGSPTAISLVPVLPTQVSVYLDSASSGLGTTKLTRVLGGEFTIEDRFGPLWVVDAAQNSFVTHLETEPTVQLTLRMEADAAGMARLTQMRDGSTRFLRIEAIGSQIYEGATDYFYRLSIDVAGKIGDVGDLSDEDGVFAVEWTFDAVHDATWGKALHVEVVNEQAAL